MFYPKTAYTHAAFKLFMVIHARKSPIIFGQILISWMIVKLINTILFIYVIKTAISATHQWSVPCNVLDKVQSNDVIRAQTEYFVKRDLKAVHVYH